jgi:hypothetical protein
MSLIVCGNLESMTYVVTRTYLCMTDDLYCATRERKIHPTMWKTNNRAPLLKAILHDNAKIPRPSLSGTKSKKNKFAKSADIVRSLSCPVHTSGPTLIVDSIVRVLWESWSSVTWLPAKVPRRPSKAMSFGLPTPSSSLIPGE